jgi:uroporphyrinogen decarboxylase
MSVTENPGQMKPAEAHLPMTPRQRLVSALRCEPVDRVPGWLMRQAGRYLPQYQQVRRQYDFLQLCKTPEAAAEVSIQPLEAIGTDAVIIFNDIMLPLEHAGARVEFDDRGPLVERPPESMEQFMSLPGHRVTPDEPVTATIRIVRERVGEDIPILGFIGAPWTLATYWLEGRVEKQFRRIGSLRFSHPEYLHAVLDRITRCAAEYLEIQVRAGADAVQIFDTWGSILSAEEWAEFSAPYIQRILDHVRPLGVPVILYVNGCAPYLRQMAELKPDAISIDWRIDLAAAKSGVGDSIALQGNIDPLVLLADPATADTAVRKLFINFPPGPGHVFNLGHGVLPGTRVESAARLMEAVKLYGTC